MQSPISFSGGEEPELRALGTMPCASPASASPSPLASRLWKPATQRNLRNQWSRLLSSKRQWGSTASEGRSGATTLVNTYLSLRYMPNMNLGVLKDMPVIRQKACEKLAWKQEQCRSKLLSSYKDLFALGSNFMFKASACYPPSSYGGLRPVMMLSLKPLLHLNYLLHLAMNYFSVDVVYRLVEVCSSMRCFLKGSSDGPLVQFTHHSEDKNDPGDGGGIAVFSFWPLAYFEKLAQELVGMFVLELNFKRLIVVQLLSIACQETSSAQIDGINWSNELYQGEFDDLDLIGLFSKERCQPIPSRILDFQSDNPVTEKVNQNPDRDILQVYLTAWISDVNVDMKRVDEIFALVEEEMKVKLS